MIRGHFLWAENIYFPPLCLDGGHFSPVVPHPFLPPLQWCTLAQEKWRHSEDNQCEHSHPGEHECWLMMNYCEGGRKLSASYCKNREMCEATGPTQALRFLVLYSFAKVRQRIRQFSSEDSSKHYEAPIGVHKNDLAYFEVRINLPEWCFRPMKYFFDENVQRLRDDNEWCHQHAWSVR